MAFSGAVCCFLFRLRRSRGPPIMLEGLRHHLVQGIGRLGCVDLIPLTDQFLINCADSVAEHIHLQLFRRGKALAVAVGLGDSQRCFIGILINKIAERVKSGGLQRTPEDVQMLLPIGKQMKAEIPVVLAAFRRHVIIQNVLEIGVHHVIFIFEIAIKGGSADRSLRHDHVDGNLLEIMLGDQAVKGI